jgi:predicted regulator of Ras-like GTPase activity (Roadblock/LC7/MglB family)
VGAIEAALRSGKVVFSWKFIRSWVKPPLPWGQSSALDATALELPMKVITPLFLAELRTSRTQRQVNVDQKIPDLFSHATRPAPGAFVPPPAASPAAPPVATAEITMAAPGPIPVNPIPMTPIAMAPIPMVTPVPASMGGTDTNYFGRNDAGANPEADTVTIKHGATPGTSFLKRYATPNEIINKSSILPGVAGSLIALPDRLLVASKLPADMNADTLAGFLPQIFGRVTQSTKELRMGELNNLNFTVGQVPWKIFRVGSIFFAAFGHPGCVLPTAQLAALAAELDRKDKVS